MTSVSVPVRRLAHAVEFALPAYATMGAAGVDLAAAIREPISIPPLGRSLVPTGLEVALPSGFELQIRPRSGLALRHGIMLANSPGTIDADYRGELKVILLNTGSTPFTVTRGMRIAQAVLAPVTRILWQEVLELPETARSHGGFGSTGL